MTYFDELIAQGVPEKIGADGFTFEDLFDELIASNQKTWKQDRALTVGASECFGCIRKSWFTKRGSEFGVERDDYYEESWGAMERGNMIENHYIVPALEEGLTRRGLKLIMAGDGQDTILDGIHSATLDGLIITEDGTKLPADFLEYYAPEIDFSNEDSLVIEMKSFDPRLTLTHEKPQHRGQTQMQMGLIRETTEYNPNYAVLIYVNASWLDDLRVFIIPYDDSEYRIGRERNEKVFSLDDAGLFAPEGKLDGMCTYCPFQDACNAVSQRRVPEARKVLSKKEIDAQDKELLDELRPVVLKRDDVKQQIKDLEKKLEAHNEEIRQQLILSGTSRAVADDFKATYTFQKGRKQLSKNKLIEKGLDPEEFMTEGNGFEKLTVTVAKQET